MEAAATALPLPDDALAAVLARLPAHTLAASRSVCKAWRTLVDARRLLLPLGVRGIFINYMDYWLPRPLFFARPSPAFPRICDDLGYGSVIDHCNGLLLCGEEGRCEYFVVNPATRWRDRLPPPRRHTYQQDHVAYLVFDPAVSPHYEVFLIPHVPEKPKAIDPSDVPPKPVNLSGLFSSFDDALGAEDTEEEFIEEPAAPPPLSIEEGFFPEKRLSLSLMWKLLELNDTYGLIEWPPSPCTLHVFSSSTRRWEERTFVREGQAMGTVKDMRLDSLHPSCWGRRWRCGVYWRETLYIHCRGEFLMRLSLTAGKYQVIKTPIDIEDIYARSHLGGSVGGVYFAAIHGHQLQVWILNESCGQIEWVLKHHIDLDRSALWTAARMNDLQTIDGPWVLMGAKNCEDTENKMLPEEHFVWDSDDDGILHYEDGDDEYCRIIFILGFHPHKEVFFLMASLTGVALHLKTAKVQWLGEACPADYNTWFKGVHEAFPYAPCMIGGPPL